MIVHDKVIPPDFPSTGSDMQPSGGASGCTCGEEGQVCSCCHCSGGDGEDGHGHDDGGDDSRPCW